MNDDQDDVRPPVHWGDFGALILAGGFSLFGLYLIGDMLLGGHPLAVLFGTPARQTHQPVPSEAEQMAAPFHAQPGEVVISTKTMSSVKPTKTKPKYSKRR